MALTSNRVYISQYQLGAWAGTNYSVSYLMERYLGQQSNIKPVFYGTLFQAGIKDFIIDEQMAGELPNADYIRNNTQFIPPKGNDDETEIISEMFSTYLPDNYNQDNQYKKVWVLESFLKDLCVAIRESAGLVSTFSIPEPETYQGLLPTELLIPISNLLSLPLIDSF